MLNIAMLSGWHVHAKGYGEELKKMKDTVSITAVWDEEPKRGQAWAQALGADFEGDLNRLLTRQDVDAVVVDAPTNLHAEVMIAAAHAGKHIFTEKVLAPTLSEAKAIAEAVGQAGVQFCISYPHRTFPPNLYAKKILEEGLLGDISLLRVRNAHNGASAGWLPPHFYDPVACAGGAMMDLGAHPMYLSRWLLGKPKSITSLFNHVTGRAVEDNAVSVIEFQNNAIAIVETGFVTPNSPFCLELYGTEGSLLIGGPDNTVKVASSKNKTAGWWVPETLPAALPSALAQWVDGILSGSTIHFGLEDAVALTELMEGAYQSYREGRRIDF